MILAATAVVAVALLIGCHAATALKRFIVGCIAEDERGIIDDPVAGGGMLFHTSGASR